MTTSLPTDKSVASGTAFPAEALAFAGLPDVEALTRLANEYFAALPDGGGSFLQTATTEPKAAPALDGLDEAALATIPLDGIAAPVPRDGSAGFYFLRPAPANALPEPGAIGVPPSASSREPRPAPQEGTAPPLAADPSLTGGGALAALPHYFLAGVQAPRVASPDLNPASFGPGPDVLPDLGLPRTTAPGVAAPKGVTPGGAPVTAGGEAAHASLYFLGEMVSVPGDPACQGQEPQENQVAHLDSAHPGFDVWQVRRDFPILNETVHGKPLIWLDNAATTQKPQAVIDRLAYFYQHENSNIHRAAHELAARATDAYEAARDTVARFLGAGSRDEIVFVRGTTEGINLIAQSWGRRHIGQDDEIVITWLEHHANIVPWQQLCAEKGARLRVAPVDDSGQILLDEYERLLGPRTKLVAFSQVSNALGTVTPAREMIEIAHRYGARVLLDGAQGAPHMRVDVKALDCDWYVFSGHKVFGPTGIGAVYGKLDLLNATPPWQGGGNMIQDVTFERTLFQPAPARFEAGTGNIADAVGLGAALEYVERIGQENISRHEHDLLVHATHGLLEIPGLRLIGTAHEKASVLSFVLEGFRSEDVGEALNREGIAVRSGHHCAQPILRRFGLETTVRPSLAFYNTFGEVDALVDAVRRIQGGSFALRR
ncbi:MAG: family 2A encapsulin nanocompartment cargo protein cysteine desulfurase [Methylococcus sp.]